MNWTRLNNGIKMPLIGIGTFILNPDQAEQSVLNSLTNEYRIIDTANAYVNEKGVGRGIKKSGVKREEIFLETKLWPAFYEEEDMEEIAKINKNVRYYEPSSEKLASYSMYKPDLDTQK